MFYTLCVRNINQSLPECADHGPSPLPSCVCSLRSVISALFWLTIAVAAAICIALAAVSQDPYLVWMYGAIGVVGFVSGCVFYACFFPRGKWTRSY